MEKGPAPGRSHELSPRAKKLKGKDESQAKEGEPFQQHWQASRWN